jgi:hypothetical protein
MIEIKFKELNISKYSEMRAWCKNQFGAEESFGFLTIQVDKPNGISIWYTQGDFPNQPFTATPVEVGQALFVFKNDKDATFFSLRWANEQA